MGSSTRWHHGYFSLATITAVLSLLLAVTGILNLSTTSVEETQRGTSWQTIALNALEGSNSEGTRVAPSAETAVAVVDNDLVGQGIPSGNGHCPMNLSLTVVCPDVLSSAVGPPFIPVAPGITFAANPAAQAAGPPVGDPRAPLQPVSLIRLSISRV